MFKSRAQKLNNEMANHINDTTAALGSGIDYRMFREDLYDLRTKLLSQTVFSRKRRKIDRKIKKSLIKINEHISGGCANAAQSYEEILRLLINARGNRNENYPITKDYLKLFEKKEELGLETDKINKCYDEKERLKKRMNAMKHNDPQKISCKTNLKVAEYKFIEANQKVKNLAEHIYAAESLGGMEETAQYYKKLFDGQILPDNLENLSTKVSYYKDKVEMVNEINNEIINELHNDTREKVFGDNYDEKVSDGESESNGGNNDDELEDKEYENGDVPEHM